MYSVRITLFKSSFDFKHGEVPSVRGNGIGTKFIVCIIVVVTKQRGNPSGDEKRKNPEHRAENLAF